MAISLNDEEWRRLSELRRFQIVDALAESTYDEIVQLAAEIFDTRA